MYKVYDDESILEAAYSMLDVEPGTLTMKHSNIIDQFGEWQLQFHILHRGHPVFKGGVNAEGEAWLEDAS